MIIIRGILEMLQIADGNTPKSFSDFTTISIRSRRLSSATVSKRLDELIKVKAIEQVVHKSKTGRRIIAYRTTEKGKRILELSKELESAFANSRMQMTVALRTRVGK